MFTAQRKARADKKRMTRLAAVLGGTLLLMLAANAGLTWAGERAGAAPRGQRRGRAGGCMGCGHVW